MELIDACKSLRRGPVAPHMGRIVTPRRTIGRSKGISMLWNKSRGKKFSNPRTVLARTVLERTVLVEFEPGKCSSI